MAFPVGMAISAGAGLIGDIIGGGAAADANRLNAEISLLNYYNQRSAQQQALMEGRRQQSEAKLGTTDAQGNKTYFIPGVGWVTDLSDTQQAISDASEQEQLRQLSQGARDERVQGRSNDRRNREDVSATEAEREFRAARRPDQGSLRQLLIARGAQGRNAQADAVGENVARANIRGGGDNAAVIRQGARASADAESARQAGIEAEMQSRVMADQEFAADRDAPMQLYDYFRKMSTSGTGGGPVYNPTGPTSNQGQAANFGSQMIAAQGQAPQMAYQSGDFSKADMFSGIGNTLGSLYSAFKNNQDDERRRTNVGGF